MGLGHFERNIWVDDSLYRKKFKGAEWNKAQEEVGRSRVKWREWRE